MITEKILKLKDNLSENGNEEYIEQSFERQRQDNYYTPFKPMSCYRIRRD